MVKPPFSLWFPYGSSAAQALVDHFEGLLRLRIGLRRAVA